MSKPRNKSTTYDSLRAAAAGMGLPMSTLKTAKTRGCPAFRSNRIYSAELESWLKANPIDAAGGVDEFSLKEQKLKEEVRKLQLANDVKAGRLIERAKVAEMMRGASGRLSTYRARSEAEHPSRIPDGDIASKRRVIQEIWTEVWAQLGSLQAYFSEAEKPKRKPAKRKATKARRKKAA